MTLPALLVVIPTTRGPLCLRSLKARPGLPAPAAFADGDYRPLPWSGDYARLGAAGGPLARLAEEALPPHELRLSGSFDAGRSWEVPVCLAHGLAARGARFVAEPAEAGLILWATGAVDLDLAVLPGDYALLDKIERSRTLLAEVPEVPLAVLLPEGPERGQAEAAFRTLGRSAPPLVLPAATVAEALAALARQAEPLNPVPPPVPVRPPAPPPRRGTRLALPLGALAVAGLAAALALGARHAPGAGSGEPPAAETAPPPAVPAAEAPAPGAAEPTRVATETPAAEEAKRPPAPSPAIRVEELRAPSGSSCRRVAFGADPPERRRVAVKAEGRLAPSRLVPELCGLAVRAEAPGLRIEVGPELRAAALPPVWLADGAKGYFLREGARQNLVYAVHAVPEAGAGPPGARLVHALTR